MKTLLLTKRKRNDQGGAARVRKEPFLDTEDQRLGRVEDETLENVLFFLDQTIDAKLQRKDDGRLVSASLGSKIEGIVSFFRTEHSDLDSLSKQDVSSLLIPWAAKSLLFLAAGEDSHQSDLAILWKTLALSLEVVVSGAESESTDLNQALPTQVLNKLVPFAVQSAVSAKMVSIRTHSARSFTLITDHCYRPTFDLFCNTLLVDLAAQVGADAVLNEDHLELPNHDLESIVLSSLRLLRTLQKLGVSSPKKMFQALAKEPVLLAVSKLSLIQATDQDTSIQTLIREVLWEAFFSPANHIEGYRSMKIGLPDASWTSAEEGNEPIFRCYQGDLLNSVWSLLGRSTGEVETQAMSQLVVSLVEGFIVQALVWQRDYKSRSKSKSEGSISTLLFRLWGNLAGALLMKLESRGSQGIDHLMAPFTSCLKVLLKHDGYHPTYEDKDQYHFLFLKSVSTRLLALVKQQRSSTGLEAMACILQLNHLVVHDDLAVTIALATSSSRSGDRKHFHLLICTLFKIYQQLRQIDYLVEALVSSLSSFEPSSQDKQVKSYGTVLQEALEDSEVTETIAFAISAAPHGQTQALFEIFNSWIVKEVSSMQVYDVQSVEPISIVAGLFVLLLRNLRVDEHTSKQILSLCQQSLAGCGSILLARSKGCAGSLELAKDGIRLCGWIVDLQNRCSFWSSAADVAELSSLHQPEEFLSLLQGLRGDSAKSEGAVNDRSDLYKIARCELQFLACYRIQQLHSLIHQKQRDEFSLDSNASSSKNELLIEARRLVDFVVSSAGYVENRQIANSMSAHRYNAESPWILLAQFLPAWTTYCDNVHIQVFLGWMFCALSGLEEKRYDDHPSTRPLFQPLSISAETKTAADALLRDSSFFENRKIVSEFVSAGLFHVQALIATDYRVRASFASLVDANNEESNWHEVPGTTRAVFASGIEMSFQETNPSSSLPYFRGALQILDVLNAGPYGSRKCEPVGKLLSYLLAMDVSVRFLLTDETDDHDLVSAGLGLLAGIRSLLSKISLESDRSKVKDFLCCHEWSASLIMGTIASTNEVSRCCCPNMSTTEFQKLVTSSGELLETVALVCFDEDGVETLQQLVGKSIIGSKLKLNSIDRHLIHSCAKGIKYATIEKPDVAREFARSLLDKSMMYFSETRTEEGSSFLLFVGDLLSLVGADSHPACKDLIVKQISSCDLTESANEFNYLAGVVLKQGLVENVSMVLYDHVASSESFGSIDNTILCRMVSQVPSSDFSNFLDQCLTPPRFGESAQAARILRLLLATTELQDRRQVIARFGTRILAAAMDGLRTDQNKEPRRTRAAADLLIELTKHKDVVIFKERDIARLLSQICCSLQVINLKDMNDADVEIYSLSCAVVVSLVQRFPKQLYTCVASLTLALQKLFRVVLNGAQGDNQLVDQARDFSRLCEMLGAHKDILKKHILGLILDFVDALIDDMAPIRKKMLTPTVYFLLEMLSEYEVNQLNALLDTTSKALFRSVYQGYQKWHVYKGRF